MATKSLECYTILAAFLDEKTLAKLCKKHENKYNTSQFLTDLFEIICERFPCNFDQETDVIIGEGVKMFNLIELASRIPDIFSSQNVFSTSSQYLKELENRENYSECLKICKIIGEIIKYCSFDWLIGVNTKELGIQERSEFEESKKNIVQFLSSLSKVIDLMPLKAEQLKDHGKLCIYPAVLQLCHIVVEKVSESLETDVHRSLKLSILKNVACQLLMTCIQQIGKQNWIIGSSEKVSQEFLDSLIVIFCSCDIDGKNSEKHLFLSEFLGNILESMKLFMVNCKLPDCPVAIHVLVWCVRNVKHPYLGEYISMILPPLLLLVDDYRVENCVTGIQTLSHVIDNVNSTELCWYGRADIIYDALHHRIHTNEPQVMIVLQPCLLKIIKVLEPSPVRADADFKMNKIDENFQIILTVMEFENKILMRRAFCSNLATFVNHMGIRTVKHFKRLLRVIFGYLGIGDGETEGWRIVMLDVLKCVICNAWPRITHHVEDILKSLMKLIIDLVLSSLAPKDVKDLMLGKIKECFVLLLSISSESVKNQLECMTANLGLREAEELISSALDVYKTNSQITN